MTHVTDQIEIYLTGGLSADERAAFEQHVAGCAACAAALEDARMADAAIAGLFAAHRPAAGFEDRIVQRFRDERQGRRLWLGQPIVHPMVRRAAVGIAASLLLGGIGYVGSTALNGGRVPVVTGMLDNARAIGIGRAMGNAGRAKHASNLRQIGQSMVMYDSERFTNNQLGSIATSAQSRGEIVSHDTNSVSNVDDAVPNNWAMYYKAGGSDGAKAKVSWGEKQGGREPKALEELSKSVDRGPAAAAVAPPTSTSGATPRGGAAVSTAGGFGFAPPADAQRNDYFSVTDINRASGGPGTSGKDQGGQQVNRGIVMLGNQSGPVSGPSAGVRFEMRAPVSSPVPGGSGGGGAGGFGAGRALTEGDQVVQQVEAGKPVTVIVNGETVTTGANGTVAAPLAEQQTESAAPAVTTPAAPAVDGPANAQQQVRPQPAQPAVGNDAAAGRKVIRSGEMEFEVESFETASTTVAKVVAEEQGYVATTNSDKLPNGKVKGSLVLRVPPEHVDTLVLKLRGIGDLRTQRIGAQDITKQYTDIQSALTAAHAMYDRLLDIIKTGKGQVKDLLEAERQLGVWREKIEQLTGEIKYYDQMVSLSTITLTLYERDIRTPAFASETETVTMNLETEKVDEAYAKARTAITEAKGRIVTSELKQFDAGQFGATVTAQVPADAADATVNRLRQLDGRVTRFERQRSQTTSNGNSPVDPRAADPLKVKREDVTISLTLYNLANVAPRRTTSLTLVANNVEEAYRSLIEQVRSAGGRVVTSSINKPKPDQVAGVVSFNVPAEKADVVLAALRGTGEILRTDTAEAADSPNVTESKRGFSVTVASLSAFAAREAQSIQLAAANVPETFNDVLNAVKAKGGRILTSQLNEQDVRNAVGTLEFEVTRDAAAAVEQAMRKGETISRNVTRSTDTENTVDSKVHLSVQIGSAETLPARQSTDLSVEVQDVQKAAEDLTAAALAVGGRQVDSPAVNQGDGQTTATVVVDVPLSQAQALIDRADGMGTRKARRTSIDPRAPEGKLARARVAVTFASQAALASADNSIWSGIRRGLATSLRGLSVSLTMIVVGVCLVAPWALLLWAIWRVARGARARRETVVVAPSAGAPPQGA